MSVLPGKILLATDGSPDAELATTAAVDLSTRSGAELHVVHVGRSLSDHAEAMPKDYALLFAREAEELLGWQTKSIESAGGIVARAHLRFGRPSEEILDLATEIGAGMIVVGSRGRGPVERLVMGSVSEDLVFRSSCPVLILRGDGLPWPPASVVTGDDSSREATEAGELAADIGGLFGARGFLVHAYPSLPEVSEEDVLDARVVESAMHREDDALRERAAGLKGPLGHAPEVKVGVGDAAALILGVALEAEPALVAVGSRGFGVDEPVKLGYARLGSVSTKVIRASRGPVLVCPAPERAGEGGTR